MTNWLRLGAALALCASWGWAVDWKALRPQGFVSDYAGVINERTKTELEEYCAEVQRATGVRISLVTLNSLQGEPLDDVATTIFHHWGEAVNITPGTDQRVMLILTVSDRHDWFETGAGLKADMAAGLGPHVLRETRVALRKRDFNEALRAAADTIGSAAAKAHHTALRARIGRSIHWSPLDAIPWVVVAGGVVILAVLMWRGNPAGYGGFGGRGLIPGLMVRSPMSRSTWGSRGSGGFGGFDSGDSSGGFGGGCCRDW